MSPALDFPTGSSKLTPIQDWFLRDTGWITMTPLLNGWVSVATPQYRRVDGIVYLRGRVQSGTASTNIFVLPAGFRPIVQVNKIARNGATNDCGSLVVFDIGDVRPGSALSIPNLDCEFMAA
jgi:hypothetical protein